MNENKIIRRVTAIGVGGNIVLVAFKLYAGIAGHSGAMVSDAVHSLSDVFATAIAFVGVLLSRRAPDAEHPYGHERLECVASLLLGVILAGTGLAIGWKGAQTLLGGHYETLQLPSLIALIAAIVSIVSKEAMFRYTRHWARRLNSSAFMADAWHHRSDALSSVGSLVGIGGGMLGYPVMDCIASVVICVFILKTAFDILRDALEKMLDTACDKDFEEEVSALIRSRPGVASLDVLHTRKFGERIYIDAEISVDGDMTLREAHDIAEEVHDAVEAKYPTIKHIMIHQNPAPAGSTSDAE